MDDDFADFEPVEAADDDFDGFGDEVAAQDDDFHIDLNNRYETEDSLNNEFRQLHAWYEAETGEPLVIDELPQVLIDRFHTFDMEIGRHLSLVESVQKLDKQARWDAEEEESFMAGFNEG